MVNRMLNNKAVQKLETVNPLIKLSTNKMIQALITNRKSPKVTRVAGSVKKIKMGLTNMFSNPKTTATMIAVT